MKEYSMSKSEYKTEMLNKRKVLFEKADEQVHKIIYEPELYIRYLQLLATLGYTVTNTLMIMADNPNATCVKDYSRWKELDAYPKKGEKGIPILEPTKKQYKRKDGSMGSSYNIKFVFDISQTNYVGKLNFKQFPSKQDLLDAVSYKCDINPIVVKEDYDYPRNAFYSEKDNCIYLNKNQDIDDMITGLMREYSYIEFKIPCDFVMYSVVYMLCHKYGVSNENLAFLRDFHQFFMSKSNKQGKYDLEEIKRVFTILTKRIDNGLYAKENKKNESTL